MRFMSGHQPHYLASVELFAKIAASDVFVVSDDVKYVGKDWQNRNRVRARGSTRGWQWLTVPVQGGDDGAMIHEKRVAGGRWPAKHARTLKQVYRKMRGWPLVQRFADRIGEVKEGDSLADLCIELTVMACEILLLRPHPRFVRATELQANRGNIADASEKLAAQMREVACDAYISGSSGPDYLDAAAFPARSVHVFHWRPYGYGSLPNLSVVDLIAHKGADSRRYLGKWWLEVWP